MKTYTETRQMMIGIDAKFSSMPEEWEPRINLSRANLSEANLSEANLSEANLYRANPYGADLSRAIGIVAVHFAGFSMYIQAKMAKIGCKYMSHEDWLKIDVDTAVKMGIQREHFAVYHAFFEAAMLVLKNENPTRQS